MTQKFSTGASVFTRTRGLEPRNPSDLHPVAVQHGIDPAFIPNYPGDRVTIMRAITHASRGLAREGFLLRPIRRTSSEANSRSSAKATFRSCWAGSTLRTSRSAIDARSSRCGGWDSI